MSKVNIAKIIAGLKKTVKKEQPKQVIKPAHRERDMRQEAMDMGAHGAKEYFGESNGR